ncbi:MAG: GNAT family N-acetyltransferase [Candidatus Handelsmanbacteria bacterium]|nr:GNAT family N-acetyltransferase [Candidatus Handelsmanbacteria bacterium]
MGQTTKENLPQLRMVYRKPTPPQVPALPQGYRLRPYQPGDESGWAALLNANGELGEWNLERVAGVLAGGLVGQFFVVGPNDLAACAGVHDVVLDGEECWEIGWVASHPGHRGRGLGALVTAAALAHALTLPARTIVLRTDDFRLPAIKVYLRLGFAPRYDHPSFPERWCLLAGHLGPGYRVKEPDSA